MIFTFQKINSTTKHLMYAKNKDDAFDEMTTKFGSDHTYSLVAFCDVEKFALTLK